MPDIAHTAHDMISGMTPALQPGIFAFVSTQDTALIATLAPQALSTFREHEGMSLLLPLEVAAASHLNVDHPMRCITLNVYSSLEGVGLTAAVATALGQAAIPCNMIAAHHHDHVFVPAETAEAALDVLKRLQAEGA